jgi:hypothetical protein
MGLGALQAAPPERQPDAANDSEHRLEIARAAYVVMKRAQSDLDQAEEVLRQGNLVAAARGISRADQFAAYTKKVEAQKLLERALGVAS